MAKPKKPLRVFTAVLSRGRTRGKYTSSSPSGGAAKAFQQLKGTHKDLIVTVAEIEDKKLLPSRYRYRVQRLRLKTPRVVKRRDGREYTIEFQNKVTAVGDGEDPAATESEAEASQ
jgi:hypothetical protein